MTREWQTIPSLPESRDLAFGLGAADFGRVRPILGALLDQA